MRHLIEHGLTFLPQCYWQEPTEPIFGPVFKIDKTKKPCLSNTSQIYEDLAESANSFLEIGDDLILPVEDRLGLVMGLSTCFL